MNVVALIAAFNEADVIGSVVADLIDQGVRVYFLDDGSTDETVAAVEPYVAPGGRGVIAIERLPRDDRYNWERILCRKTELARELDADWFIHHDADEFRESPWPGATLADAIQRVDALGYNAIDFASLDFWPVHDNFKAGDDVRAAFPFYSERAPYDGVQIRCWKKATDVDLVATGGHEARFAGRRVFPLRFVMRHYPIRSQAHGERKVFQERRGRFRDEERERGWHVQYDTIGAGASFLRDPATLTAYDPIDVRTRLALRHRGVEEHERALEQLRADIEARVQQVAACEQYIDVQARELETRGQHIVRLNDETAGLRAETAGLRAETASLHAETASLRAEIPNLRDEIASLRRRAVEQSAALARTAEESEARREYIDVQRDGLAFLASALDRRAAESDDRLAYINTQRDGITFLTSALDRRTAESEERRMYIDVQRDGVAFLTAAVARQRDEVDRWRASLEDARRRLNDVERSLSWRLTSPLRALFRVFARRHDG